MKVSYLALLSGVIGFLLATESAIGVSHTQQGELTVYTR